MATSTALPSSDTELTVAILESELGPLAAKWEKLGRKLRLQEWRLEIIAADHPAGDGASLRRLSAVLREWRNNVTDVSWRTIISALREMEENLLANEIEMKYCSVTCKVSPILSCKSQQERSEEADALIRINEVMMKDRFAQLQTVINDRIQERLDAKEIKPRNFRVYMTTLFPPGECIPDTTDVSEIFTAITHNCLWDYLNYQPLERVANMYGGNDPDLKAMLEMYAEDLNGFKLATKMADYLTVATITNSNESHYDESSLPLARKDQHFRRELRVKLKIPISVKSLSYVDEVWKSLAKQFLLPPSSAILDKIIEGSLYVTWLIPAFFVPQMMELAEYPHVYEFFQQLKAEIVTVAGACIYEEEKGSADSSINEDQESPPKPEGLAITVDSESVANQHHRMQDSSDVCGGEESQLYEKKLSSKHNKLSTTTNSFKEERKDTATDEELQETLLEESSIAVKSTNDNRKPHPHSHPESCPPPYSPQPQITGYDVELVKESPDLRCPICLLVLRDPMQVSCCGKRFCCPCIKTIITGEKPCPACNCITGEFDIFEDKAQKQAILEVKVHCSNRKIGCGWKGEICQLDNHLNPDPEKEKIDMGCQYIKLKCIHCSEDCQRHHIRSCPQQPYTCPYCNHYSSTYEDVNSHHLSMCDEFPVQCEVCSVTVPQKNLQHHYLDCAKSKDHSHSSNTSLKFATPSPVFVSPPNFIMADFSSCKDGEGSWYDSPPFYSHIGGYKMCVSVDTNGYVSNDNTYVLVYVCLMRGEYDDNLTWPFRGEVTIQL